MRAGGKVSTIEETLHPQQQHRATRSRASLEEERVYGQPWNAQSVCNCRGRTQPRESLESCPGRPLQYNFGFQQQHGATGSRASLEEERVPHPQQQHGGATHSRASFEGTPPTEPLAAELLLRTMVERSYLDRGNPSVDNAPLAAELLLGAICRNKSTSITFQSSRGRQNNFAKGLKIAQLR